jgi:hypothetical protein
MAFWRLWISRSWRFGLDVYCVSAFIDFALMAFRFGRLCRFCVYGFRVDGVSARRFGLDVYAVSASKNCSLVQMSLLTSEQHFFRASNA